MISLYAGQSGTIDIRSVKGNAIVNKDGAVLKETVIDGHLYLAPGIGDGDARLDRVTVRGTTFVLGGGEHSIHIRDSHLNTLVVDRQEGPVRVVLDGTVETLRIEGPARIVLEEGAVIKQLILAPGAGQSVIEGKGSVQTFDNHAAEVRFNGQLLPAGISSGKGVTPASGGGGGGGNPSTPANPWTLVWSDEFDDNTIDPAKWTFDLTNGASVNNPGWGNNELQYYTSRPDNVKEENGRLVITARKENYEGFGYTSSRIKTKGLFSKTYGKFEIRAKTPAGKGLWPAIWMLPENSAYGVWAASGELDIMETWGSRPDTIAGTIHYGQQWPGNTHSGNEYKFTDSTTQQFHTYSIEWEPNEIRWYVDGILYSTKNDWYSRSQNEPANYAYPAPFDQPFHLLMNLAVGGNFDGDPTPDTVFPQAMEIDYVRVYELTGRSYHPPTPPTFVKEAYAPGSKLPQAPDNDLVYNGGFTETIVGDPGMGIDGTAHWNLFQEANASASVAIEPINNRNYIKVNIASAGSNAYSVQPLSIVSLAKGRNYKLTFEAKTDTVRGLNVKLTGGQSRGFVAYSPTLSAPLTDTFQTYEMIFQMKEASDAAARIEFNMGTNSRPVWLGNVKLVEVDALPFDHDSPKIPYGSEGNHIYNGTFDLGEPDRLSYWHLTAQGSAVAAANVDPAVRKLNVAVTNGGSGAQDVQLTQKGLSLIQGQPYRLTWEGSAGAPRQVNVRFVSKDGSEVYAEQAINLTALDENHTFSFTMQGATTDEGQLVFQLGGSTGTLRWDNVKLVRLGEYLDPDVVKFPLRNGQFDAGLAAWSGIANDGAALTPSVEQSQAKLAIGAIGTQPWSVLFLQDELLTANTVSYIVQFDAYATTNRKLQVVAENGSYQRAFDRTVDLTATKQRFKFEFTKSGTETVGLKFLLGAIPGDTALGAHDVFLDNIVFEPKAAVAVSNRLANGTFDADAAGWTSYFHDAAGVAGSVAAEDGEMKVEVSRSGPDSWNAQIDYENATIEQNKSYRLSFDARASISRSIQVVVEHKGGDYQKYLEPRTVQLTSQMQSFSYTFSSSSATDAGAHVNFLLGRIDAEIGSPHSVWFDNVSLVEVPAASSEGRSLQNGHFDENMEYWKTYLSDGAETSGFSIDNQSLKVDFPNYDGWFPWSTQLYQDQLQLLAGKTYVLSFKASSSINKSVLVQVERSGSGLHLSAQSLALTAAADTYSFEFTVGGEQDENAKLNFLLGSQNVPGDQFQPHSIWIDEVALTEKP
jgi:beta-glucanase (GH16 family)